MTRCMGCMAEMKEDEKVCRHCGYKKDTKIKEVYYLLPGTVLKKKYLIGRVLGYGGFGVTYIGWDYVLQRRVAVKEYLPSDSATRSYGSKRVTVFSGEKLQQYRDGLENFLYEARRLAKLNFVEETVDIYDCFEENDSGYIVMEYLEGVTIKEVLRKRKRISVDQARAIALAVLRGLTAVHKEGIIHRDIAPDNIFLTKTGKVKILDFGAARYASALQSKSLSVILKPGFAPEEQYRSHGVQGPWTDIYALGATLYNMITGIRPEESIRRMADDRLKTPSELGISVDSYIENAIMNSLNVSQECRIQDAAGFYRALRGNEGEVCITEKGKRNKKISRKLPPWIICTAAAVCVLLCAGIGLAAAKNQGSANKATADENAAAELSSSFRYVPDISGMSCDEARETLGQHDLKLMISGMEYSEDIAKNKIISQQPRDGETAELNGTVYVIVSGGREEIMMPDLAGMTREEAEQLITKQKLILHTDGISREYSDVVQKGRVMKQSIPADERVAVQTEIQLLVSLGSRSEKTALMEVPDLTGLTLEKAVRQLEKYKEEHGFTFPIGEVVYKYGTKAEDGRIFSQSPKAGECVRTDEPICIVISRDQKIVQVPELLYMTKEQAVKKLKEAGLAAEAVEEYSGQAAPGLVIRQDMAAGAKTAAGSRVTISVSIGEESVRQS